MLNDATAGQVLNKFVEQGKLKMLPRGAHDKGVWVKVWLKQLKWENIEKSEKWTLIKREKKNDYTTFG